MCCQGAGGISSAPTPGRHTVPRTRHSQKDEPIPVHIRQENRQILARGMPAQPPPSFIRKIHATANGRDSMPLPCLCVRPWIRAKRRLWFLGFRGGPGQADHIHGMALHIGGALGAVPPEAVAVE